MSTNTAPDSERLRFFKSRWKLVASAIGFGVGIGWLADAINDGPLFKSWLWATCWVDAVCISSTGIQIGIGIVLALIVTGISAFTLTTQIGGGKVVQLTEQKLRPHKILIMWLSTGKDTSETTADGVLQVRWSANARHIGPLTLTSDPEADAQRSGDPRWNMWQHIRAVKPHASELLALHMLVTAGDQGSESRYDFARQMFQHYLGLDDAVIRPAELIKEHDSIQSQIDTVRRLVEDIKATTPHIKDSDIMVDCTGGLKVASIAAACATLNNDIELQYVNTNTNAVETYQLVYMAPQI